MRTVTIEELQDQDSDFYLEEFARDAQKWGKTARKMIDAGKERLAFGAARLAAQSGRAALEVIERRGSDDIAFFIFADGEEPGTAPRF